ncbi:MAG TPA: MFS transporter [Opitutaceae bacterium]|nr:MFS transporter [Opitutaceae bacterium]
MGDSLAFPAATQRARFGVAALLFANVVINYMDRANLSVAGPAMGRDLGLTARELGWVFSAFGWAYAALQIPGGWLVDQVRPRLLYAGTLAAWSLATVLQGLAGTFAALFGLRLATGACEAPAYPINNRVVTAWFPEQERASAIAFYTAGQFVGLAFLQPVMAAVQRHYGWRGLFVFTGLVGIGWAFVWYLLYRDPAPPGSVGGSSASHSLFRGGATEERGRSADRRLLQPLREACGHRRLWGVYLGQFAVTSALWFFLTWFPTYLEKYRGFTGASAGWLRSVPFLAAFAGIMTSGLLSDFLVRRGVSAGVARKTPVIAGLLLTTAIVGANYVTGRAPVIFFLSVAFFGNGLASITWVFISLMAPRHLLGLTGGIFNFCGNLSSVVVPVAIGYLVGEGSFAPALVFIAAIAGGGICSYLFLVGEVGPVDAPAPP